ncbi:MAG: XdhC family protein, partial [Pseudonocardia sp.]|nr:XdhC family protein [Pseudonocardia sp.]
MRDVLAKLDEWWGKGETAALATVVGTYSSAPRQPGA